MQKETKTSFAKKLRKQQTPFEFLLWGHLRNRQLGGYKFKRQYLIEPYIVDFCCVEKKLIVELDGGAHIKDRDDKRDRYLRSLGYGVVRVWNHEFDENKAAVLELLLSELRACTPPSLTLLPQGGEGKS